MPDIFLSKVQDVRDFFLFLSPLSRFSMFLPGQGRKEMLA